MIVDPVYTGWKRKYPKFPGVTKCIELLSRHNVRGSMVDIICGELEENAKAHAAELIAGFQTEQNAWVRRILLGVISEAKLPEALSLFIEHLQSPDESLRYRSEEGLRALNTPEARKALWEAGRGSRSR